MAVDETIKQALWIRDLLKSLLGASLTIHQLANILTKPLPKTSFDLLAPKSPPPDCLSREPAA
ncbi:hypothetical protein PtB15_14B356 [Puccinia triticina]|nr:hypothetical protein PtB15_14B356 [Puccinia triticina]